MRRNRAFRGLRRRYCIASRVRPLTAHASFAPIAPVLPDPWEALKTLKAQMEAEAATTYGQQPAVAINFAPPAAINSHAALPEWISTTPWLGQRVRFQATA